MARLYLPESPFIGNDAADTDPGKHGSFPVAGTPPTQASRRESRNTFFPSPAGTGSSDF